MEDHTMSDNKMMRDGRDRAKVNSQEQYEVAYFAQKHGLSAVEARKIIEQAGPSREAADEAASRNKPN
jgi:hypothetical protein